MSEFKDKVVLITGGTKGIGEAIASAFVKAGAVVHITGTSETAAAYDANLEAYTYHKLQVESREGRQALHAALPEIDILVNNAGGGNAREFELEGFSSVVDINLTAVFDLCRLYKAALSARGGNIVNVSSVAGVVALKDNPAYTAAKAGLLGLTRALADKWSRDGIRVNAVAPGFIRTTLTDRLRVDEDAERRMMSAIPLRRWGRPEEIAAPILFLASAGASYITGETLMVDGGVILR